MVKKVETSDMPDNHHGGKGHAINLIVLVIIVFVAGLLVGYCAGSFRFMIGPVAEARARNDEMVKAVSYTHLRAHET